MQVICFKKSVIKSKKTGAEYVKIPYLMKSGETGEIFASKEEFDKSNFPESKCFAQEDLAQLFDSFQTVDVQFDNRGHFVHAE